MEFKHTVKVHCGNLLQEIVVRADQLNLTDTGMLNMTWAANDTTADKLLGILKDTGCNDQVCEQLRELMVGSPPNFKYKDRNGSTYDEYFLFLSNQG